MELNEKALDFQQRLKKRINIRKIKSKLVRGKKLAARRMATNSRIKKRSQGAAKNILVRKLSGGKNYSTLGTSQKIAIDRTLENKRGLIAKIAKRLFAGKRKEEMARLASARTNHNQSSKNHPRPKATAHSEEMITDLNMIAEIFNEGVLQEGKYDPAIFKAVFLAGGPGSGKSYTAEKIAFKAMGFKLVNVDSFFEQALKKAGMPLSGDSIFSPKGQEIRAKAANRKVEYEKLILKGRLGMIIDGTGKDITKIAESKRGLEAIGYETSMVLVSTSLEMSQSRNLERERQLPSKELEKIWKEVQKNIGEYAHMFGGRFHIIDNSTGEDGKKKYDKQTLQVYKEISKWARTPVNNPAAKEWRESQ